MHIHHNLRGSGVDAASDGDVMSDEEIAEIAAVEIRPGYSTEKRAKIILKVIKKIRATALKEFQ